MRKREFLRELRIRLRRVDCREIEDIINYYDELIEDTIDRTGKREEDVVYDLGPISDIVIRVNSNGSNSQREKEERIRYDEYDDRERKESPRPSQKRKKKKHPILLGILIAVLTSPIWLSAIIALCGILIGVIAAGFGIGVAGIGFVGYGIASFGVNFANALFQIGLGIIFIGLTFIFAPLIAKIVLGMVKLIGRFVKWLLGLTPKKERMCYEN